MSIISEFKQFAIKGNAFQLAIAVVLGAAFGKVVNSFVADILMPPLGLLIGGIDFRQFKLQLKQGTIDAHGKQTEGVYLSYGSFFQTIIEFLIIAAAIFFLIKIINRITHIEEESKEEAPSKQEILLSEIRDLLKSQNPKI